MSIIELEPEITVEPTVEIDDTALDLLRRARALISDPSRWCQGQMLDGHGRMCAVGALVSAATWTVPPDAKDAYVEATNAISETLLQHRYAWHNLSIPGFNDTHTHAQVMLLFDRTIARLEAHD